MPAPGFGGFGTTRGLIGLYALRLMERDGPVHGYLVAEAIAERTEGLWRPGAGAIYPSLQRLVARGLARATRQDRRTVYSITPTGRALLRRIRTARAFRQRTRRDLSALWADVLGERDVGEFLLTRLNTAGEALETYLRQPGGRTVPGLIDRAEVTLEGWRARLRAIVDVPVARRRSAPMGRGAA